MPSSTRLRDGAYYSSTTLVLLTRCSGASALRHDGSCDGPRAKAGSPATPVRGTATADSSTLMVAWSRGAACTAR